MIRDVYWALFPQVIDKEICRILRQKCLDLTTKPAKINGSNAPAIDEKIRKSEVAFFDHSSWVNGILHHYIYLANKKAWNFEIDGYQSAQYAVYNDGDFYDWHKDEFSKEYHGDVQDWIGKNRKLTAVLNISEEHGFEGGGLAIKTPYGEEVIIEESRGLGSIVVFPSYIVHKAIGVTSGQRESITLWAMGPSFK